MNKKEKKNKRAMTQLKAYFLIVNMILAIVAFGWMVNDYNYLCKLNSSNKLERFKYRGIFDSKW